MEMAPEVLTFMPNGDVTLTLIRHVYQEVDSPGSENKAAAVEEQELDEDAEIEAALGIEPETPGEGDNTLYYAPDAPGAEDGPFYPPPPRAKRGSDERDRSASPPASFWAALKRQAAKINIDTVVEDENAPKAAVKTEKIIVSSHEVQCIVSSRHLMLASRYFETILSGEFEEAKALRATGHVEITMPEEDLDSMTILLNIIHGASRKVPRNVSLEVLSKLAVLVSKYGMLETVEFFSDTWIDHLQREGLPKAYTKEVLRLLFVFWVFNRETEFRDMTRLAQREADDKFEEDVGKLEGVKIPSGIIDAIKQARVSAMETALSVIHTLITKYMDGSALCDAALDEELRYACDAMVLGSLLKSSRKIGIWPKPEAPFAGRKYNGLAKAIRGIRILDVCNKTSSRRWNSHGPSGNSHGLEDVIEEKLKEVEKELDGLRLFDFAKKSEDYIPVLQRPPPQPVVKAPINGDAKKEMNGFKTHSQAYGERIAIVKPEQEQEPTPEEPRAPISPARSRPPLVTNNSREAYAVQQPTQERSKPEDQQQQSSNPYHQQQQQESKPDIQRQHSSQQIQPTRGRSPPRTTSQQEKLQPESRTTERHTSPSLFSWPSETPLREPEPEVKVIPKSQQSSGFVQQESQAQYSPRNSVQEIYIAKPVAVTHVQERHNLNGFGQQETQPQQPVRNGVHEATATKLVTAEPVQQRHSQSGLSQREMQTRSSPRNSIHEITISKPAMISTSQQRQNGQNGHNGQNGQTGHNGQNSNSSATATMPNRKPISTPPTPTSPTSREEAPAPQPRDVSKVVAADKKLSRTPSYPQMPSGREDVKSPAPEEPRVASMDQNAMMEGVLLSPRNGNPNLTATNNRDERKANISAPVATTERKSPSPPTPASVAPIMNRGRDGREKSPPTAGIIRGRESPLKQVQLVGDPEEKKEKDEVVIEEEVWIPPVQNFRTRKGKKTFSTRFS
ncbi:hypothetical protein BKA65DRAFT_518044 [Rhexocercosporidium sp. MPI-PUGE-AT-0058]|nr:hypothetical protein BKA65DRAFT_518044 [Rhexocercosporidium sp. MPI-PUGE-AT-0058]